MALENRLIYIRSFWWHLLRGRSVAVSAKVKICVHLVRTCQDWAAVTFATRALASNFESNRLLAPNLWFQDLSSAFGTQSLQLPLSPEFPLKKWLFQAATNIIFRQLSAKLSKTVPSGYTASYKYLAWKCAVLGHRAQGEDLVLGLGIGFEIKPAHNWHQGIDSLDKFCDRQVPGVN